MMRKNHNQLMSEYDSKYKTLKGIEARIKARAEELTERFPDVSMGLSSNNSITTKDYLDDAMLYESTQNQTGGDFVTKMYLKVINTIEQHNQKQSGVTQGKLFQS
jgi:hypothetical protein